MAKRQSKTILCHNPECGKRFVPKRAGRGFRQRQVCPHCKQVSEPPKSVSQLKQEVWDEYSQMVRRQEADKDGMCTCCYCGKRKPWGAMDACHFLRGRWKGILFERRGIHPGCKQCNQIDHHEQYREYIVKRYGEQEVERQRQLKWNRDDGEWTRDELLAIRSDVREQLRILDVTKG